jgi:hypothetical protein
VSDTGAVLMDSALILECPQGIARPRLHMPSNHGLA